MEELELVFRDAEQFTMENHKLDYDALHKQASIITDFGSFYREYCYVVVASGFKGGIAARLAEDLANCKGDYDKCYKVFKNKAKILAICKCYELLSSEYATVFQTWKTPEDLQELPYIGPVTCFHLARNIGLESCVKPDLHLKRLISGIFCKDKEEFVQQTIVRLAKQQDLQPGLVDFCLWVWLSHNKGEVRDCCNGGVRLR